MIGDGVVVFVLLGVAMGVAALAVYGVFLLIT